MGDVSWYYEEAGKQAGPVTQDALLELARSGRLAPAARVWRAGMAGWAPWTTVPELASQVAPPAAPPPPLTTPGAAAFPPNSYAADVVNASAGVVPYPKAPFGGRFVAYLLDSLIVLVGVLPWAAVIGAGAAGSTALAWIFGAVALATTIWAIVYGFTKDGRPGGQSIGKKAMGLMVVHLPSNQPCTRGQSAVRYLVLFLCNAVPYVGWLVEPIVTLAAQGGRRLGDQAAGTQVIEASAYRAR
jgi:uncharacterized RDD family membrane protein YckC